MKYVVAAAIGAALVGGACASSAPAAPSARPSVAPEKAARIDAFANRMMGGPFAPPGFSLAVVAADGPILVKGYGVANRETGAPVTTDTAFYNASATKAFTALAAVLMEERGEIDLDATLGDYFPGLELPAPLDAHEIVLRKLLSHSAQVDLGALSGVTAFYRRLDPDEVVRVMECCALRIEDAFRYGNDGYVALDAIFQREFDADWRDLVAREVLEPLGLTETYARSSEIPDGDLAIGYEIRDAAGQTYEAMPPKPDALMHAAGGLYVSTDDVARWMTAQLTHGSIDGVQLAPASAFATAQAPVAAQEREMGPFKRHAYAHGWNIGTYDGDAIYEHGGGYPGARAMYTYMPDHGVSASTAATLGDGGVGFSLAVIQYAYDVLLGKDDLDARADRYAADYVERTAATIARNQERRAETLASATWFPTVEELAAFEGRFADPWLYGPIEVALENGELVGRMETMTLRLTPADPGEFFVETVPFTGISRIVSARAEDGSVESLDWGDDDIFVRE